ncbi:hypothetical protein FOZ62_001374 [Perkinsus olseni]|uniref:Kinesin motor domain-containing protein n=1 Tax=Perkinsus olseni TaxID=32597 RepID=A0A7J6U7U8_PEROL|nr:hypothetical protein FOZ62_001374 [Perkinsus olseni]
MMGRDGDDGIIPRIVESLFDTMQHDTTGETKVWVSYLEIYNERIQDLLSAGGVAEGEVLQIFDHPKYGVVVPGIFECPVESMDEVQRLMDYGIKRRAVGATNMNSHSSRSHAVFTLRLERSARDGLGEGEEVGDAKVSLNSRLNLVDLSGSERTSKTGADGDRLREGTAINQSLTNLGVCIRELAEKAGRWSSGEYHIPFRNSKLTFLLKDSLSGNSRTFMLAAISPSPSETEETLGEMVIDRHNWLRRSLGEWEVRLTPEKLRNQSAYDMVQELQAEIRNLKREVDEHRRLAVEREENQIDPEVHEQLQDELKMREKVMQSMKGRFENQLLEAKRLAVERQRLLNNYGLAEVEAGEGRTPYLHNVSPDPLLSGRLIYRIPLKTVVSIGSAHDNRIVLQGLGMTRHLATLETEEGKEVELKLCGSPSKCRVVVNRKVVQSTVKLRNGDRIVFGRAFTMTLVFLGPPPPIPDDLGESWEELETSKAFQRFSRTPDGLREELSRVNGNAWKGVMRVLEELCPAVDEANEISEDLKPVEKNRYFFELASMYSGQYDDADDPDEIDPREFLVVRVLTKPVGAEKFRAKYTWMVDRFMDRLERLRDVYHKYHRLTYAERAEENGYGGGWDAKVPVDVECPPCSDPWRELSLGEWEQLRAEAIVADRKSTAFRDSAKKVAMVNRAVGRFQAVRTAVLPPSSETSAGTQERVKEFDRIDEMIREAFSGMKDHLRMVEELRVSAEG